MAVKEAEVAGTENNAIIGVEFDFPKEEITLHYTYDDEYCYYRLIPLE
jgi:hypothetical protein